MLPDLVNQIALLTKVVQSIADSHPQLVTVQQAADYFQVSTKTVRRMVKSKKWPHVMVGNQIRINLTAILCSKANVTAG